MNAAAQSNWMHMKKTFILFLFTLAFGVLLIGERATAQGYIPLWIPDTLSGTTFDLTPAPSFTHFLSGPSTPTEGINGPIWGPTLIFRQGDSVHINVHNGLDDATTVHWHGMHLPPTADGGPHQPIPSSGWWHPSWKVTNNAATYWYHPHLHMLTERQLLLGLGGLIIIRDSLESALPLPRTYGVDDIPLVLTDRRFNHDSNNVIASSHYGDTMLTNFTFNAGFTVPAQFVRFRILCGTNERFYKIGFSDNRTFYIITSDGGLLNAPVPVTRIVLGPGERVEILVNFAGQQGKAVNMKAFNTELALDQPGSEPIDYPIPDFANGLGHRDFNILHLQIGNPTANPITKLPTKLASNVFWDTTKVNATRHIRMTDAEGADGAPVSTSWFNGKFFDFARIDFHVKRDNIEIWELENQSAIEHPFHIHDIQFHILDRNGVPPPLEEQGWKDVVRVTSGSTVRFITRFTDFSDSLNPYMYHCHIAYHEDAGMMGQFVVEGPPSTVSVPGALATEDLSSVVFYSNFPEPVTSLTKLRFRLPSEQVVTLKVYNVLGDEVATLENRRLPAGNHDVTFDATNLLSGHYFLRLQSGSTVLTRQMTKLSR
jgi:blue copper oxidase